MPTHAYQQSPIPSPAIQRIFEPVQAMRDNQTMHTVDPSASGAHPKPVDRDQRTHTTAPLATQEGSSTQLWVIGLWDKTPIKMAFDPSDTGEAFYQAFHQWAVRRKRGGDFDRQRMTLFLKANKNMPDEEAYDLGLGVSELEQFWKDAMEWAMRMVNEKSHIAGGMKRNKESALMADSNFQSHSEEVEHYIGPSAAT
ncbi:unnamed protein product [Alternaria alternata]